MQKNKKKMIDSLKINEKDVEWIKQETPPFVGDK